MKRCSGCKEFLEESLFNKKGSGLQSKCKECNKQYLKKHYEENPDYYSNKARAYREEVKKRIIHLKETTACADCDKTYAYYQMEFDHVDGKNFEISAGLRNRYSWEKLEKEIMLCDLVCVMCHRKRTHLRLDICLSDCCTALSSSMV